MKGTFIFSILGILMMSVIQGCYSNEPTATQYKKSAAPQSAEPADDPGTGDAVADDGDAGAGAGAGADDGAGEVDAETLDLGQSVFQRCEGCHASDGNLPLDALLASDFIENQGITPAHEPIQWPTEEEAAALEAFLKPEGT